MTKFFDSNLIQEEIEEIHDLQGICFANSFEFDKMSYESQKEHIDNLLTLLDKQKVMYTRLSLTDDPDAKKTKKNLERSVRLLGFPEGTNMQILFEQMESTIKLMKEKMDDK